MKNYQFWVQSLALLLASLAFGASCARPGMRSSPPQKISVSMKDALFVFTPVVPDTVDSWVSQLGWAKGRFATELRQEIAFQFNQKGIAIVQDSSAGNAFLRLNLKNYADGRGGASQSSGEVLLQTQRGERVYLIGKTIQGGRGIERSDPTIDNIRKIAQEIVKEAYKTQIRRQARPSESNPPLLMTF